MKINIINKKTLSKILGIFVTMLSLTVCFSMLFGTTALYAAIAGENAIYINYIKKSVLPSGGIAKYPVGKSILNEIVPYWSNLAVCGIASEIKFGSNTPTQKQELIDIGINAINWYKSRQDQTTGIVYDYSLFGIKEASKGTMDSVDSYSASYLMAINCMNKVVPEFKLTLKSYQPSIILAIKSLQNLLDKDGLTFAKPNYNIKYLMDNVEVWAGLQSINQILVELKDTKTLFVSRFISQKIQNAINRNLWDPATGSYRWAIANSEDGSEVVSTTDWNIYYPDALENIWPGVFGFREGSDKSFALANKFASYNYIDSGIAKGQWNPFVGLAFYNSKLRIQAKDSFDYTTKMLKEDSLGGLYTSGHAGMSLMLHYKLNKNQSLVW